MNYFFEKEHLFTNSSESFIPLPLPQPTQMSIQLSKGFILTTLSIYPVSSKTTKFKFL